MRWIQNRPWPRPALVLAALLTLSGCAGAELTPEQVAVGVERCKALKLKPELERSYLYIRKVRCVP